MIIGGRYGSVTQDGISYIEKEYNYAKSLSIPILGFVHGDPENIPVSKTEREIAGRGRLETFRTRVMHEHPIRTWTTAQELGGLVSRSVSRALKVKPRPGWVRNTGSSNLELLEQINILTLENMKLKEKANKESDLVDNADEFSHGAELTELSGYANIHKKTDPTYKIETQGLSAESSWDDLFRYVGPLLMNEATDITIKRELSTFVSWSEDIDRKINYIQTSEISPEIFAEIIVQFRALGLVDKGFRRRAVSDRGSY